MERERNIEGIGIKEEDREIFSITLPRLKELEKGIKEEDGEIFSISLLRLEELEREGEERDRGNKNKRERFRES